MPLKTFAKREEVPEAQREKALELKDGQFVISEDEDTSGLKNSVGAARKERDDAIAAQRAAEAKAADKQRELDAHKAATGDTEKKTADLLAQWKRDTDAAVEAAKKELQGKVDELTGFKTTKLRDDELRKAFRKAGGREDLEEDVIVLTRGNFKLVDGDKLVNVDEHGNVTTTAPEQFYAKLKETRGVFFKGTQGDGGGADGGGTGGTASLSTKPPTAWSSEERAKFINENGQDAYTKLLDDQVRQSATAAATKKAAA